jgi:mono/diheme cytochrome c family protein
MNLMNSLGGVATIFCLVALGCSDDGTMTPVGGGGTGNPATGGSAGSNATGGSLATTAGSGGTSSFPQGGGGSGAITAGTGTGGSLATGGAGGSLATGGTGGTGGSVATGGSGGTAPLDPGEALFMANCVMCHGEQGIGTLLAPGIQHPMREYFTWVVRNGRAMTTYMKPMEKWGTDKISDADLMLIWDYLDKPPQPTTGQALFIDYCSNCHGKDAKSGPAMHNLANEVAKINDMVRMGAHPGEYEMRKEFMPVFSTERLPDADLKLIHDYIDSL